MQAEEEKYTQAERHQHQLCVVKAASSFSKALGQDSDVVQKLYHKIRQGVKKSKPRIVDEQSEITKIRATFINFRRKLEGDLIEEEVTGTSPKDRAISK